MRARAYDSISQALAVRLAAIKAQRDAALLGDRDSDQERPILCSSMSAVPNVTTDH